jgi:hypothetical protein
MECGSEGTVTPKELRTFFRENTALSDPAIELGRLLLGGEIHSTINLADAMGAERTTAVECLNRLCKAGRLERTPLAHETRDSIEVYYPVDDLPVTLTGLFTWAALAQGLDPNTRMSMDFPIQFRERFGP